MEQKLLPFQLWLQTWALCPSDIHQAQRYINEGYRWTVDMDLEKFFDRVNHNKLMTRVKRRVTDERILKLINRYLKAGLSD